MQFEDFFRKCRTEPTVSDFESYLARCVFEKRPTESKSRETFTVETYSQIRDRAFEQRDEEAARLLYDLSGAAQWKEGDWEGALK